MTERERQDLYDLQLELRAEIDALSDGVSALMHAVECVKRSHEIIGRMLQITGQLVRPS